MPIDVRRFGVGHRRPDGPPGTTGIEGQVIESGRPGTIAELAFNRRARITPHSNPNWSYFLVIEGGGWVGVGEERTRVTAGEAVVWPPDVIHAAWTDGSPMRAIVVEFSPPMLALPDVTEGVALRIEAGDADDSGVVVAGHSGDARPRARGASRPGPSTGCPTSRTRRASRTEPAARRGRAGSAGMCGAERGLVGGRLRRPGRAGRTRRRGSRRHRGDRAGPTCPGRAARRRRAPGRRRSGGWPRSR